MIKRYDHGVAHGDSQIPESFMCLSEKGAYVDYEDYAELQQKLDAMAAVAIPEGYVLVPQSMNISADAMESICFHGGDGGGQFGEFTDVILWVGDIENDDGTKTYGLKITTAEYPEEGSANISEFAEPVRSGTHDTADKAG